MAAKYAKIDRLGVVWMQILNKFQFFNSLKLLFFFLISEEKQKIFFNRKFPKIQFTIGMA